MKRIEELKNSDYIISIGTFFEEESLKNIVLNRAKNINFVYMSPIDNHLLKNSYNQFIKYEAGSEEAVITLLLNAFADHLDTKTKEFLDELDLGYLSAESSAGEEEFEEACDLSFEANNKVLIIGDDIKNHPRIENIARLIGRVEKFTELSIIILDEELEKKIEHFKDEVLEDIDNLKSFNGTIIYEIVDDEKYLVASQTFLNIAKIKEGDSIEIFTKNQNYKRVTKLDSNLLGTIALLGVDKLSKEYRYKLAKIEKSE
ncbi:NADH:quinone oxidoreductase I, chain G-like protein (cl35703 superfamily) [Aliarcobacter faecis]|uniref:hypothetical protein n=1 Tax=Aliarcobacter faecis TaxID=1564138 RepID=UPI00047C0C75|nr:hypothetical protein [Aliarcobacter faecis]QKF72331.1 NADH:quinone oxidoreductase I, chain G-like protein (cl35703 superfamily) [Aliarcobacter faecis]